MCLDKRYGFFFEKMVSRVKVVCWNTSVQKLEYTFIFNLQPTDTVEYWEKIFEKMVSRVKVKVVCRNNSVRKLEYTFIFNLQQTDTIEYWEADIS